MTFKLGDRGAKIYSMKWPLIFGLSDSSNVAQGSVSEASGTDVIVVDNKGDTKKVPYKESVKFVEEGGTTEIQAKSVTLTFAAPGNSQGVKFSTDTRTNDAFPPTQTGDIMLFCPGLRLNTGIFAQDLGVKSVDSITEAPSSGYTIGGAISPMIVGHSYALKLADGKYAVVEIINDTAAACPPKTTTVRYKYQPNGSRTF